MAVVDDILDVLPLPSLHPRLELERLVVLEGTMSIVPRIRCLDQVQLALKMVGFIRKFHVLWSVPIANKVRAAILASRISISPKLSVSMKFLERSCSLKKSSCYIVTLCKGPATLLFSRHYSLCIFNNGLSSQGYVFSDCFVFHIYHDNLNWPQYFNEFFAWSRFAKIVHQRDRCILS